MLSVIIPTYNRVEQLCVTLNKLKEQYYSDFEVIVVDDCSDDHYQLTPVDYPFTLRYYRSDINLGPSGARNLGVKFSSSEWILFLDDDDEFLPNKLFEVHNIIANHDVDFIYHRARIHMVNEGVSYISSQFDVTKNNLKLFPAILGSNFFGGPPNFVIKKELFIALNGFSEEIRAVEDYEFLIRMSKIIPTNKIYFSDRVLTSCYYTTASVSVSKNLTNLRKACDYIRVKYVSDDRNLALMFKVNQNKMMAHSMLMNLSRRSGFYYALAGVLSMNFKYIASGFICFVAPRLLIKLIGR